MPGSSGERERAWYLFRRRRDRRRDSDPPWAAGSPASWDGGRRRRRRLSHRESDVGRDKGAQKRRGPGGRCGRDCARILGLATGLILGRRSRPSSV